MKLKIVGMVLGVVAIAAMGLVMRTKHLEKTQPRVEIKLAEKQEVIRIADEFVDLSQLAEEAPVQVAQVIVAKPAPKHSRLNITEEMVSLLEQEKEAVRATASAKPTDDGWKIQVRKNDKYLSRLGIHSGDVITYDSLRAGLPDPSRGDLANRLSAVLHYLER